MEFSKSATSAPRAFSVDVLRKPQSFPKSTVITASHSEGTVLKADIPMPTALSRDSLLDASSLPDDEASNDINDFEEWGYSCRKTCSVENLSRYQRYYEHVRDRLEKAGRTYPWSEFAIATLSIDEPLTIEICHQRKKGTGFNEPPLGKQRTTDKLTDRGLSKGSQEISNKLPINPSIEEPSHEWPSSGKVKQLVRFWSGQSDKPLEGLQ